MSGDANEVPAATPLTRADRAVVKIGSSLLIDKSTGQLNRPWLESLADELAEMIHAGQQAMLVSSGAIALGRAYLGLKKSRRLLEENQAAAAAGQIILAHAYQEIMARRGIKVAQVLLTPDDTEDRRRYLNGRSTLETLLGLSVLPVINENDTVATQEIRYGDNDRLAARVAEMTSSSCLVLLSDVDGLYDRDPADPGARLVPVVREISPELLAAAGSSRTAYGSGGMATKVAAARICMSAGCATLIAAGSHMRPLSRVIAGAPCTWFLPSSTPLAARKQWIAGTLTPRGTVHIDTGAAQALLAGKSLLAVGVRTVDGRFERGDAVTVVAEGQTVARGLIAYDSDEARLIMGRHSSEFEALLGYQSQSVLIHRDNLVVLNK